MSRLDSILSLHILIFHFSFPGGGVQEFCMALTDNEDVYTWGVGTQGQLGHASFSSCEAPKLVQSLRGKEIIQVAAGARHSACVTASGEV